MCVLQCLVCGGLKGVRSMLNHSDVTIASLSNKNRQRTE